jgi:hypothetical protein
MKLAVALLLGLAVALMGGARTAGAWPAATAPHHASAHHAAHDHHAHDHHTHDHHAHKNQAHASVCDQSVAADERPDDGANHSICCAFACHAIAAQVAVTLVFPSFTASGLSPADAPVLRGGAPPGFDRPPRLA